MKYFVLVNVQPGKGNEVAKILREFMTIKKVIEVNGTFDLIVECEGNIQLTEGIINEGIRKESYVRSTLTLVERTDQ